MANFYALVTKEAVLKESLFPNLMKQTVYMGHLTQIYSQTNPSFPIANFRRNPRPDNPLLMGIHIPQIG